MKTLARYVSAAVALGALLVFAGCTTQTARAPSRVDYRVTVIEKSKDLQLTAEQAAEIQNSAVAYLKENGLSRGGEYFIRVNLTPDQPEATGQWVVLQISSQSARTYTLLAAYPGPDDSSFDYYGFTGGSYRYTGFAGYNYYEPFAYDLSNNNYYGGGYAPVPPSRNNHKPGDKDDHPSGPHPRWDPKDPDSNHSRPTNYQPRTDTPRTTPPPRTWNRDRSSDSDSGSRWSGRGNNDSSSSSSSSYSPPPPPPAPTYSAPEPAPSRSEPTTQMQDRYNPPTNEK